MTSDMCGVSSIVADATRNRLGLAPALKGRATFMPTLRVENHESSQTSSVRFSSGAVPVAIAPPRRAIALPAPQLSGRVFGLAR